MVRRLNEARDELQESMDARDDAIAAAWKAGGSLTEIAHEVGMSHPGVSKLLARMGVRKRWLSVEDANRELERRDAIERGERPEM